MHYQAIQHMPIMFTKVEFDLNYFILYRDIFLEPLIYKRGEKLKKSHISSSPFETAYEI